MPTTLLLAHPDLKTQRQLCKGVCLLTVSNVHRATYSYFSKGVHSNKETKITETLKKLSRICFNMTIYSYKSEYSIVKDSNVDLTIGNLDSKIDP